MSTLDEARCAKAQARDALSRLVPVRTIGIERRGEGFGLKVNLPSAPTALGALPQEVDGVPIRYEVIGRVKALDAPG